VGWLQPVPRHMRKTTGTTTTVTIIGITGMTTGLARFK
jgi:hypothetical protein